MMNFELTQEQRSMVNTVRELTQEVFKPNALKYMDGTFPWDNFRELAKIGVLGMAIPEEYGGLGLPVLDTALVLEEVSKGCYVTAMDLMGEVGTQARIIATYAPESIKRRLLPGVCSGDVILAVNDAKIARTAELQRVTETRRNWWKLTLGRGGQVITTALGG